MTNDLLARLRAGPGSRKLSDKVLLACGWRIETDYENDEEPMVDSPGGWPPTTPWMPPDSLRRQIGAET